MPTSDPPKLPDDDDKEARRFTNFRVLMISLVAVVLILALLYLVFSLNVPPSAD